MKTDIWPDDTSMLQMSDWLAELRDGGDAGRRPAGRHAGPVRTHGSRPEPSAAAPDWPISRVEIFAAEARARAEARANVQASARARAVARADARGRAQITARAVIGDELRMPIMWCEMGSCISWHSDPAALGEADIRGRAIEAGWRVDALGRAGMPPMPAKRRPVLGHSPGEAARPGHGDGRIADRGWPRRRRRRPRRGGGRHDPSDRAGAPPLADPGMATRTRQPLQPCPPD